MNKKKIILIIAICLAIVLLIPIPGQLKDGGSKQYTAILYQVTDYHKLNSPDGYIEGIGIEILGLEVFNNCRKYPGSGNAASNVAAEIKDISPTGASIVITDNNEPTHIYGEWYRIDRFENDKWVEVEPIIDNYGFNELAYEILEGANEIDFDIDWKWLYGELSAGKYRIVKSVGEQYIYIPFEI